jgi:hypothetical protein
MEGDKKCNCVTSVILPHLIRPCVIRTLKPEDKKDCNKETPDFAKNDDDFQAKDEKKEEMDVELIKEQPNNNLLNNWNSYLKSIKLVDNTTSLNDEERLNIKIKNDDNCNDNRSYVEEKDISIFESVVVDMNTDDSSEDYCQITIKEDNIVKRNTYGKMDMRGEVYNENNMQYLTIDSKRIHDKENNNASDCEEHTSNATNNYTSSKGDSDKDGNTNNFVSDKIEADNEKSSNNNYKLSAVDISSSKHNKSLPSIATETSITLKTNALASNANSFHKPQSNWPLAESAFECEATPLIFSDRKNNCRSPVCMKAFSARAALGAHRNATGHDTGTTLAHAASKSVLASASRTTTPFVSMKEPAPTSVACLVCKKTFSSLAALDNHCDAVNHFKCAVCMKAFSARAALGAHRNATGHDTGTTLAHAASKSVLASASRITTSVACLVCKKTFSSLAALDNHCDAVNHFNYVKTLIRH